MSVAETARAHMVTELEAALPGLSERVRAALSAVPRERFLPEGLSVEQAYADAAVTLAVGDGFPTSTASQPSVVARMLDQLCVRTGHAILEIGTASGYNAALLERLVGGSGQVHSVEIDPELAATARERLRHLAGPVTVHTADGWAGVPAAAPYDRIIATIGVYDLSPRWLEQLRDGGILVAPLWLRPGVELAVAFRNDGGVLTSRSAFRCAFLRLRGEHAGPDSYRRVTETRFATGETLSDDRLDTLRALLAETPASTTISTVPAHWFATVALRDPRAIQIFSLTDPVDISYGLFDSERRGLAVVADDRLHTYGDPAVGVELREAITRSHPIDPSHWTIHAVPADGPTSPPARSISAVTITRPHFRYTIDTER
ncbi:protein-L-isoaspartate O-methyltransferase [Nocardia terpenica]|uniref:protein-L-isoaspartate O-methyltransferase family protein n=1 Tax=Nocardia terpenica TaxID=455432 RepID=UPI0018958F6E|nr:protein-L-isoaspartate O-methyltransferase [Nocardia terpenica]MBF6066078.1 protein-L-isoaspartate O-methyltransferase [Nocardia terpenica]MBF6109231.1 protein-L-isoaspartate O-methyltransferase [Nocardia terpenica]MBF6116322.1 protein-L-isoaspartate O-methyltransferase [Nocardia terpenica]MBF6123479.1 protein-L-isoaspartate O-methyltransferase [Nocardia terpenica]MBF6156756.1 protein-L-isoaspartate O-methyltransferase [Nocardia terpenica]